MRSEDETELIESQYRKMVAPPKKRKNAPRNLGHNQIIFEHCQAIAVYTAKTEIQDTSASNATEPTTSKDTVFS